MNSTLKEIENVIRKAMAKYLPDVSADMLEEGGKVYYMNGRDGTEFEWFVNGQLPPFMVFYGDEENLGAVKTVVAKDGKITTYLYGDGGNTLVNEVEGRLNATEEELLELAVNLSVNVDDEEIWGAAIDEFELDDDVDPDDVDEFLSAGEDLDPTVVRKEVLAKFAFVSKKITKEGWKVGYMFRDEPDDEEEDDSGWQFFAGNEDDDYDEDPENVEMIPVAAVVELDPDVEEYLGSPAGSSFVRVSSDEFEEDDGQDPFVEKR